MSTLITSSMTRGQQKQYQRIVEDIVNKAICLVFEQVVADKEGWQNVLANGDKLFQTLTETLISKTRELSFTYSKQLSDWITFYKKYFNLELETANLQFPDHQEGFDRLIIVAKGLTRNQVFSVCERQFSCRRYVEDLDNTIKPDERCAQNGAYAIWVRDRVEADEDNKNQSFNKRRAQGCDDENILERMVHELKYFDETGKHLDINNWTLTSSLCADRGAVSAGWVIGKFCVDWFDPDSSFGSLRARSAVSCQPKPSGAKA